LSASKKKNIFKLKDSIRVKKNSTCGFEQRKLQDFITLLSWKHQSCFIRSARFIFVVK